MAKRAQITQADITRALRAADKAGKKVAAMLVRENELRLVFVTGTTNSANDQLADWDEVLDHG